MPTENTITTPPEAFGLAWRREREVNTRNGPRVLFLADDTDAYVRAYRLHKEELRAVGFAYAETTKWDGDFRWSVFVPAFWFDPSADQAQAAEVAANVEELVRDVFEREEVERELEWQRHGARRQASIERLRTYFEERPWAFASGVVATVEDLVQVERATEGQARFAESLLASAEQNVARAHKRLQGSVLPTDWACAADPDVRADVLEACRVLSERDEDRAQERNDRGWSQATSWTGHVLAGKKELTQREAAHALRLVYKHRKQLAPELASRLFRSASYVKNDFDKLITE